MEQYMNISLKFTRCCGFTQVNEPTTESGKFIQQEAKNMHSISISIDVPDLDSAVSFYTNGLGFKELKKAGADMVILDAGKIQVYLLQRDTNSASTKFDTPPRKYDRHWTPIHFDFDVVDMEKALQLVVAAGGIHEGGDSGDWGSIAYCSDPFGHGFCLIQEKK